MKFKIFPLIFKKVQLRGCYFLACPVLKNGRVLENGIGIHITEHEMFGEDASKDGFKMAGLDALIRDKIIEAKKYNIKPEEIEFCNAQIGIRNKYDG